MLVSAPQKIESKEIYKRTQRVADECDLVKSTLLQSFSDGSENRRRSPEKNNMFEYSSSDLWSHSLSVFVSETIVDFNI
jgi:hypothetical protein